MTIAKKNTQRSPYCLVQIRITAAHGRKFFSISVHETYPVIAERLNKPKWLDQIM